MPIAGYIAIVGANDWGLLNHNDLQTCGVPMQHGPFQGRKPPIPRRVAFCHVVDKVRKRSLHSCAAPCATTRQNARHRAVFLGFGHLPPEWIPPPATLTISIGQGYS